MSDLKNFILKCKSCDSYDIAISDISRKGIELKCNYCGKTEIIE